MGGRVHVLSNGSLIVGVVSAPQTLGLPLLPVMGRQLPTGADQNLISPARPRSFSTFIFLPRGAEDAACLIRNKDHNLPPTPAKPALVHQSVKVLRFFCDASEMQ